MPVHEPAKKNPPLPPLPGGQQYRDESKQLWESLWDERQAEQLVGVQLAPAWRWIKAFDTWLNALDEVTMMPLIGGSKGQQVANPLWAVVVSRETEMEKCEKQLGIGLRNKADLGLTFGQMRLTAQQLIEMHNQHGSPSGDDEASTGSEAGEEEDGWTAG
jgi:hypothetical protein